MQQERELWDAAIGLLARREHSRRELADKLRRRAPDEGALQALLDELQGQGLQSDERFAESFIRSRIERGQGELRIRQELGLKGIDSEAVALALEGAQLDGFELALQVRLKRFGAGVPTDRRDYARQARFLAYRGFTQEQVRYALEGGEEEGF